MILVVGLGNPGKDYSLSKHNVGFMAVDELATRLGVSIWKKAFKSLYSEALKEEKKLILLKPQIYMNRSGEAVRDAAGFFKIPAEDMIVVYDEMDLPLGNIKIKVGGGSAGHKGIESIIVNLGDLGFVRVRIGIGKPVQKSRGARHVLSGFRKEEMGVVKDTLTKAADAVLEIITQGVDSAMNKFNRKEDLKSVNQACS
ncbi:MAG TPA: aminoacyl-tRNA hydrolase [Thermodesulfobacteriota bacterium]|nr:aminoacyl-tRNA hydrolase [Thermodesulfobacteriota bacterium]